MDCSLRAGVQRRPHRRRAISTLKCNTLRGSIGLHRSEVNLFRSTEAEFLAWTGVEKIGYFIEVGLRVTRQVGSFWKILPDEAVGVFVRAALPGRMRVGEVDGQFKINCDLFVQSHLPAAIIGQGLTQRFWHGLHLVYKAAMHRV